MKLLHTMIRITDIDKSLNFYKNVLGLELSRTKELKNATLYFVKDNNDEVEIELTLNHEIPEEGYEVGTAFGHFAFETDSLDKFTEILKANNMDYTRAPFEVYAGKKIAFITDPDGYQIEIIEK